MALYSELKSTENLNEQLEIGIDGIRNFCREIWSLPLLSQRKGVLHTPEEEIRDMGAVLDFMQINYEVDIPESQRRVFKDEGYKDNLVLAQALSGEKPVEKTLEELSKAHKGVRRFLPRRKDKERNERVEAIGDLVDGSTNELRDLRANGIYCLDNPVTTAIYCGTAIYGMLSVMMNLDGLTTIPRNEELIEVLYIGASLLVAGVSGLVFSRDVDIDRLREESQYIDRKIEELF